MLQDYLLQALRRGFVPRDLACPHLTHTYWSARGIEVAPSHQSPGGFRPFPHSPGEPQFSVDVFRTTKGKVVNVGLVLL